MVPVVTPDLAGYHPDEPLFLKFVNSLHWDEGTPMEELSDEKALVAWCSDHALPADYVTGQLGPLTTMRTHCRSIVECLARGVQLVPDDIQAIEEAVRHPSGRLLLAGGGTSNASLCFEPRDAEEDEVAFEIALSLTLFLVRGDRHRLKLCASPGCGYAFLDTTKNGSRRWCDMSACGNRQKVRSFRSRFKATHAERQRFSASTVRKR